MNKKVGFLVSCSLAVFCISAAKAEIVHFKATLTPAAEVPPVKNSHAKGVVKAHYDTASRMLIWRSEQTGLSGPATMAHFHGPATKKQNADVQIPVDGNQLGNKGQGHAKLTDEQASQLMKGLWYFNYHTEKNPAGEIRGQVVRVKK